MTIDLKEWQKMYYQKNKEKINERSKKFYEDNKDHVKEYQKAYHKIHYQQNKEKLNKISKERYRLKKHPHLAMGSAPFTHDHTNCPGSSPWSGIVKN